MFIDAQEMAIKYPDSFNVPRDQCLSEISTGDFVKICASDERFWVKVTAHHEKKMVGVIYNDLLLSGKHGLFFRDTVTFSECNVYMILKASIADQLSTMGAVLSAD